MSPSEITITPLDEKFVKSALKIVEDNIANSDFTVEMLAQQIGMSRSALYKKIMAVTGLGPAEFIRTVRIKRGKALLERSQMQITEIAYSVGFNSLKSFTMNFKAEYGLTPSEYLKKKGFKWKSFYPSLFTEFGLKHWLTKQNVSEEFCQPFTDYYALKIR